eukprot:Gb_38475 [translate_table: standard]
MASPYRPKLQAPRRPNSLYVSKNNLKENNNDNVDASKSEVRASPNPKFSSGVRKSTPLPKAMKKSFMSPTVSASSKAKRILSERNDPSPLRPTWDRTPTFSSPAVDTSIDADNAETMMDYHSNARDVLAGAMEAGRIVTERSREPPSLEELQRKVKLFLEEITPQAKQKSSTSSFSEVKEPSPYHPIHSPFSTRPDFVHIDGSPVGLFGCPSDLAMIAEEAKQSSLPPYDPKKNYLSPRPQFLRYRPNRNLDIILNGESPDRVDMELDDDKDKKVAEEFVGLDEVVVQGDVVKSEDFTERELTEVNGLQSLEMQMASVDLGTEVKYEDKQCCISTEPAIVEETVSNSGIHVFEPKFNIAGEIDEEEEIEKAPKWVEFMKNLLVLSFALFSALVAILASGSPGLLPSALHDNPLATSWHSSEFYSPTIEALRGAQGFWTQEFVPPKYCYVDLEEAQKNDYTEFRGKANVFWQSVKEIAWWAAENLKRKIGLPAEVLMDSSVSELGSVPEIRKKEPWVPTLEYQEGNPSYIKEGDDKSSAHIASSEVSQIGYGDEPGETSQEVLTLSPETEIQRGVDRFYEPFSPSEIIEFESHADPESSYEVVFSSAEEEMEVGADKFYTIYSEVESFETSPVEESGMNKLDGSESHLGVGDSYESAETEFEFSETEICSETGSFQIMNTEAETFETFLIQDPEEMGLPIEGVDTRVSVSKGESDILNVEIPNELEFMESTEAFKSQVEENGEGKPEVHVVQELKASESFISSIPRKTVEDLLLYGTTSLSILAAAVAAIYLAYRSKRRPRNASPDEIPEPTSKEVITETNYPAGDGYSTPLSKRERFYPQRHYSPSIQNTLDENHLQWRGSSAPRVQLLHEYSPSQMVSTSEKKANARITSSTQGNIFYTPERRVRRKSSSTSSATYQENVATPEMSMEDSSYGSFTTYDKVLLKEADEEHVRVTPVRRSSRIRKKTMTPPSAR